MGRTFMGRVRDIRDTIRAEVSTIPDFKEGAIMLSFVVKSDIANKFLGYPCDENDSNVDVDFVYGVVPDSPKTRASGFRGMTDGEVACRGYAALKTWVSGRHGMGEEPLVIVEPEEVA